MANTKLTPRQINAARKREGKPPLNFKLFRKVIKKIEANPEAYDQTVYGRREIAAPCGTAGCVAGWAACLSGKVGISTLRRGRMSMDRTGQKALGLTEEEAEVLFGGMPRYDWPSPYSGQWARTDWDAKKQSRVAVRYLTHIISTGSVL